MKNKLNSGRCLSITVIFLDYLVVLSAETCFDHCVRVHSYVEFQNINKRELYQLSGKKVETNKNNSKFVVTGIEQGLLLYIGSFLRGCITDFNVFLMVCLSGI